MRKPSQQELDLIVSVADNLSSDNWIVGYDKDDIRQEAIIIGIQGLKKYNGKSPLDKFLFYHIRHRLFSLRRKHYIRPGCDCGECNKCLNNQAKQRIKSPSSIEDVNEDYFLYQPIDQVEINEFIELVDKAIPAELRDDYIKFLNNITINYNKKQKILSIIKGIINEK